MVRVRKKTPKEIAWVDPLNMLGSTVLGDDSVGHKVLDVNYTPNGVAYRTKCGLIFTFFTYGQSVLEAKIKQPKPTCQECLNSRSRRR